MLLLTVVSHAQKSPAINELMGFLNSDSAGINQLLRTKQFNKGGTDTEGTNYTLYFAGVNETINYQRKYGRLKIFYNSKSFSALANYRQQLKKAGFVQTDSSNDGWDRPNIRFDKKEKYYMYRVEVTVSYPKSFLLILERFVENGGPPPVFTKGGPSIKELVYFLNADTMLFSKAMRMKNYEVSWGFSDLEYDKGYTLYKKGTREQLAHLRREKKEGNKQVEFSSYNPADIAKYKSQIIAAQYILQDSVVDENKKVIYTYKKEENELCWNIIRLTSEPGYSFYLEIFLNCGELKAIELE